MAARVNSAPDYINVQAGLRREIVNFIYTFARIGARAILIRESALTSFVGASRLYLYLLVFYAFGARIDGLNT